MDKADLFLVIWIGFAVTVFLAGLIAQRRYVHQLNRAPKMIQSWAFANGYEIQATRKKSKSATRTGYTGPFNELWYKAPVFRVVVSKSGEEKRRVAWIKVGEDFKVIWEDEWRPQEPPVM